MIDALFGSKTRVKLLHLFLNNPGQSFYVREITRKIDEQINSVRRELANMLGVGIITSDSSDNKLYYQVNQRYDYYPPLRAIFSDEPFNASMFTNNISNEEGNVNIDYIKSINSISGLRLAILAGLMVKGSSSPVDILMVGDISSQKVKALIKTIEEQEGREINYTIMSYDEFYYRWSVRDKFIMEIINSQHFIALDKDNILSKNN